MKILLINVPVWKQLGFVSNYNPGMGLLYIGAVLREHGHEVRIIDAEAKRWWHEELIEEISKWNPTHIGLSFLSNGFIPALELTKLIQSKFPKIWIAVGGVGPSAMPTYVLKRFGCDSVTVGEAELVIEDSFTKYGIIQGISPEDLDALPFPAYDLMEPTIGGSEWRGNDPIPQNIDGLIRETVVMWSRGCPHSCTFCSKATMPRKYPRLRSPEKIAQELNMLKDKFKINSVFVYDDELIGMGEKHNEWLLSVLEKIPKDISYKGQGRCNQKFVTEKIAKSLKSAGFFSMMMGCESGSEKVKRAVRKGTTNDDIRYSLKTLHEAGILVYSFWMVGLPEETRNEFYETERFIMELSPYSKWFQVSIFSPLPGSDFWDEAFDKGWFGIKTDDYEAFLDSYVKVAHLNWQNLPFLEMPWMTKDEISKNYRKLLRMFDSLRG